MGVSIDLTALPLCPVLGHRNREKNRENTIIAILFFILLPNSPSSSSLPHPRSVSGTGFRTSQELVIPSSLTNNVFTFRGSMPNISQRQIHSKQRLFPFYFSFWILPFFFVRRIVLLNAARNPRSALPIYLFSTSSTSSIVPT